MNSDWLDAEEFFNAMQSYRHSREPGDVVVQFENVKRLIRCRIEQAQSDAYADGRRDERESIALDGEAS